MTQNCIAHACRQNPSSISLKAGCELFLRYTTRTSAIENEDFRVTKARLIERGNQFADTSTRARSAIADAGSRFLTNGCTVLCHGFSRVIVDILSRARKQGAHFTVLLTEGRPGEAAVRMAKELVPLGIDTTIILDSAAAYHMDRCAHLFLSVATLPFHSWPTMASSSCLGMPAQACLLPRVYWCTFGL